MPIGESSLRRGLREYDLHYHTERNHQGVSNRLLKPVDRGAQPMIQFIAENALGVSSIITIAKRLDSSRSIYCTIRGYLH